MNKKVNLYILIFNMITILQIFNIIYWKLFCEWTNLKEGISCTITFYFNSTILLTFTIFVFARLLHLIKINNYSIPLFFIFLLLVSNISFYGYFLLPTIIILTIIFKKSKPSFFSKDKKNVNNFMLLLNYCFFFVLLLLLLYINYNSHPDVIYKIGFFNKITKKPERIEDFNFYLNTFDYGFQSVEIKKDEFIENIKVKRNLNFQNTLIESNNLYPSYYLKIIEKMKCSKPSEPIIIEEILYIPQNINFLIKQGTTFQFMVNTGIICEGTIIANGTEQNQIIFESIDFCKNWQGMVIAGNSEFSYCKFQNINCQKLKLTSEHWGSICINTLDDVNEKNKVIFKNCSFANNKSQFGGALYIAIPSKVNLLNCNFNYNESLKGGAIYIDNQKGLNKRTIRLVNCIFRNNNSYAEGKDIFLDFRDLQYSPIFQNTHAIIQKEYYYPID